MAERTSEKKLTTGELIVQKMKETFDRSSNNGNVWVMAVTATSFCEDENGDNSSLVEPKPSHRVRVVLRIREPGEEANPYVDGSDFFLEVDEQQQVVEFVWEDESFADAPLLHGSQVLTAIRWTSELTESLLCIRLEDLFSNKKTQEREEIEVKLGTAGVDETWM